MYTLKAFTSALLIMFTFVTFGLGALPEGNPEDGGLLIIGFSDKKPKQVPIISNHGIVLFTLEF